MSVKELKVKNATDILRKYLADDNVYDYMKFAGRFNESSGRYGNIDGWIKFAKEVLTAEEYEKFYYRVYPFESKTPETEELKNKLIDMAKRIYNNNAGLYDVLEELNMSMHQYIYLLKNLTYRHKAINVSCYRKNADYYNLVSSYEKEGELTSSYPTLGKDIHNKLIEFIKEHNLPVNNINYVEAYGAFKNRGLIILNTVKK